MVARAQEEVGRGFAVCRGGAAQVLHRCCTGAQHSPPLPAAAAGGGGFSGARDAATRRRQPSGPSRRKLHTAHCAYSPKKRAEPHHRLLARHLLAPRPTPLLTDMCRCATRGTGLRCSFLLRSSGEGGRGESGPAPAPGEAARRRRRQRWRRSGSRRGQSPSGGGGGRARRRRRPGPLLPGSSRGCCGCPRSSAGGGLSVLVGMPQCAGSSGAALYVCL